MQKIDPSVQTQAIYFWCRVHSTSVLEGQKIKDDMAQIILALAFGAFECLLSALLWKEGTEISVFWIHN